jgi:hypothetical protein
MARIPTPALPGQEVGSVRGRAVAQPFQNLQTSADMFGAAQGRALQQASKAMDAVADGLLKSAEQDDTTALLETQAASSQFETDLMDNAETGVLSRKLKGAQGASKDAMSAFDAWAASQTTATTTAGRAAQMQFFNRMKASILQRASAHERVEVNKYKASQLTTIIGNSQTRMADLYNDDTTLSNERKSIEASAGNYADYSQLDTEGRATYIREQLSKGSKGAISAAVSKQDYVRAKTLLDRYSDEMMPEDREAAAKLVQGATIKGEGQRAADAIMAKPGLTGEQRLAEARKLSDFAQSPGLAAAIRDEAVSRVRARIDEAEVFKKRAIADRFNNASERAAKGESISEADLDGLNYYQRKHIRDAEDNARKMAADPDYNRPGDGGVSMDDYRTKSADPKYLTGIGLDDLKAKYELNVAKAEWDMIASEWRSANLEAATLKASDERRLSEEQRKVSMASSDLALLKTTFRATTSNNPDKDHADFLAWQTEFNRQVLASNATTPAQRSEIINRMAASKVVYDNDWWDSSAQAFQLDEKQIKNLAEDADVPSAQRAIFKEAYPIMSASLNVQKIPITRASIMAEWKRISTAANSVEPQQRASFLANYQTMTSVLVRQGIPLTSDNYVKLFRNNAR